MIDFNQNNFVNILVTSFVSFLCLVFFAVDICRPGFSICLAAIVTFLSFTANKSANPLSLRFCVQPAQWFCE